MQKKARPNVIVFGETGVGKSSVINMINGNEVAKTSDGAKGVTFESTPYNTTLAVPKDLDIMLWDTAGLNEGDKGTVATKDAIANLYRLIRRLDEGISLLVFCMRGPRITENTVKNYKMFYSVLCQKKVPIVLLVTGGESLQNGWLEQNAPHFQKEKMQFADRACVTAAKGKMQRGIRPFEKEYEESARLAQTLIAHHYRRDPWKMDAKNWLFSTVTDMFCSIIGISDTSPSMVTNVIWQALKSEGLSNREARQHLPQGRRPGPKWFPQLLWGPRNSKPGHEQAPELVPSSSSQGRPTTGDSDDVTTEEVFSEPSALSGNEDALPYFFEYAGPDRPNQPKQTPPSFTGAEVSRPAKYEFPSQGGADTLQDATRKRVSPPHSTRPHPKDSNRGRSTDGDQLNSSQIESNDNTASGKKSDVDAVGALMYQHSSVTTYPLGSTSPSAAASTNNSVYSSASSSPATSFMPHDSDTSQSTAVESIEINSLHPASPETTNSPKDMNSLTIAVGAVPNNSTSDSASSPATSITAKGDDTNASRNAATAESSNSHLHPTASQTTSPSEDHIAAATPNHPVSSGTPAASIMLQSHDTDASQNAAATGSNECSVGPETSILPHSSVDSSSVAATTPLDSDISPVASSSREISSPKQVTDSVTIIGETPDAGDPEAVTKSMELDNSAKPPGCSLSDISSNSATSVASHSQMNDGVDCIEGQCDSGCGCGSACGGHGWLPSQSEIAASKKGAGVSPIAPGRAVDEGNTVSEDAVGINSDGGETYPFVPSTAVTDKQSASQEQDIFVAKSSPSPPVQIHHIPSADDSHPDSLSSADIQARETGPPLAGQVAIAKNMSTSDLAPCTELDEGAARSVSDVSYPGAEIDNDGGSRASPAASQLSSQPSSPSIKPPTIHDEPKQGTNVGPEEVNAEQAMDVVLTFVGAQREELITNADRSALGHVKSLLARLTRHAPSTINTHK